MYDASSSRPTASRLWRVRFVPCSAVMEDPREYILTVTTAWTFFSCVEKGRYAYASYAVRIIALLAALSCASRLVFSNYSLIFSTQKSCVSCARRCAQWRRLVPRPRPGRISPPGVSNDYSVIGFVASLRAAFSRVQRHHCCSISACDLLGLSNFLSLIPRTFLLSLCVDERSEMVQHPYHHRGDAHLVGRKRPSRLFLWRSQGPSVHRCVLLRI